MTSVPEAPVPAKVVLTRVVLNQADIDRALTRIAHEILESNKGSQDLVLLGIPRRGYPLAVRLAAKIAAADPTVDPAAIVGQLDVTMFRDDLSHQAMRPPYPTQLPRTGIDNKVVVLIDDGHRELPIRADHVGKNLPTSSSEKVRVRLAETDTVDGEPVNEVVIEATA